MGKAAKQAYRGPRYRKHVLATLEKCRDLIVFDFETTGLQSATHRVIEVAAIKYHLNENNAMIEVDRLHLYIRPPFLVEPKIVELTKITNEFLATCPWEEDVIDKVFDFFGDGSIPVCGHNIIKFDSNFLKALYERHDRPMLDPYTEIDTIEMSRDIWPEEKSHKLIDVARRCGINVDEIVFHSAIEDVKVTAQIFWVMLWNYIAPEEARPVEKKRPAIRSFSYFSITTKDGPIRRVYVNTSEGSIYYDGRSHSWWHKDPNVNLDAIDMEYVENFCLSYERCATADQFLKKMEQVGKRFVA